MSNSNKKRVKKSNNVKNTPQEQQEKNVRQKMTGKQFVVEVAAYFVIVLIASLVQYVGDTFLGLSSNYSKIVTWAAAAFIGLLIWDKVKWKLSVYKNPDNKKK